LSGKTSEQAPWVTSVDLAGNCSFSHPENPQPALQLPSLLTMGSLIKI